MSANSYSRVGSANAYDVARSNLMGRQTALANLQEGLTSGKRVTRASDDPTAAAQAERALNRISRIQSDQRALESQRTSITQAEGTLGDVSDALQSARDLVISAGSSTTTPAQRQIIAGQLSALRDQMLNLANTKDTNGQPLFGSLASALAPFTGPQASAPDYTFNGLPGQSTSSEVAIPFSLDGNAAFMHSAATDGVYNVTTSAIPTTRQFSSGNVSVSNAAAVTGASYAIAITAVDTTTTPGTTTVSYSVTDNSTPPVTSTQTAPGYPTGQSASIAVAGMAGLSLTMKGSPVVGDTLNVAPSPSIFSVIDNAIRDIGSASNSNAAIQAIGQAVNNIDIGLQKVLAVRGQAGELLNRADRITSNQDARSIQMEANRSRAEDMDMVKGISALQSQQTGYQAALQSYAQVQKLSLFNYIS